MLENKAAVVLGNITIPEKKLFLSGGATKLKLFLCYPYDASRENIVTIWAAF